MRIVALIVLSACAADDSPAARRAELEADNQVDCGRAAYDRCNSPNAGELSAKCLNDTLASGGRARYSVGSLNNAWFNEDKEYFTIDHQVEVFAYYPDPGGDGKHDAGYTEKLGTCTGPFVVSAPDPCAIGSGSSVAVSATNCL